MSIKISIWVKDVSFSGRNISTFLWRLYFGNQLLPRPMHCKKEKESPLALEAPSFLSSLVLLIFSPSSPSWKTVKSFAENKVWILRIQIWFLWRWKLSSFLWNFCLTIRISQFVNFKCTKAYIRPLCNSKFRPINGKLRD